MDASPHSFVADDHRRIRESYARCLKRHEVRATVAKITPSARRALRAAAVNPLHC